MLRHCLSTCIPMAMVMTISLFLKNQAEILLKPLKSKRPDAIYLVKISKSLANFISNFEENIEKGLTNETESVESNAGFDAIEDPDTDSEADIN